MSSRRVSIWFAAIAGSLLAIALVASVLVGSRMRNPTTQQQSPGSASPETPGEAARLVKELPSTIEGLRLTRTATGAEAAQDISQLHEGKTGNLDAYIAEYRDTSGASDRHIKVWLSVSAGDSKAELLILRMTEGIKAMAARREMYSKPRSVEVRGREVIETRDLHINTENYYWRDSNRVIWLETDGDDSSWAKQALEAWMDVQ